MSRVVKQLKQTAVYQSWIRPVVWALINAFRRARESRHDRVFQRFAARETPQLTEARRQHESLYVGEQDPLVSVTIPTYNRGRLLVESTLPSVLSQTYEHLEVIIVGDHCTDDTVDRIARINDPRVHFHNLPKRPRYPRNKIDRWKVAGTNTAETVFRMARGPWIAHLDDDDVFTPDHVEVLLRHAQTGNYELVAGVGRIEMRPGEWVERASGLHRTGRFIAHPHSCVLYRSYLRLFMYDRRCLKVGLAADAHRWRRMFTSGVRTGLVDRVVTLAPLRPGEVERGIFQPD